MSQWSVTGTTAAGDFMPCKLDEGGFFLQFTTSRQKRKEKPTEPLREAKP